VSLPVLAQGRGEIVRRRTRRSEVGRRERREEGDGEQERADGQNAGGEPESDGGDGVPRFVTARRLREYVSGGARSDGGAMNVALAAGMGKLGREGISWAGTDRHWGLVTAAHLNKSLKGLNKTGQAAVDAGAGDAGDAGDAGVREKRS
jgi:hypothetical protein